MAFRSRQTTGRRDLAGKRSSVSNTPLHFEALEDRLMLSYSGAYDAFASLLPANDDGSVAALQAVDAGDSANDALDLGRLDSARTVNGFVGGEDRRDFFRFDLANESAVEIALTQLSQDIDLYLFNSRGQRLGHSIEPGSRSESLAQELGPGTYYLLVAPYASNASTYRLTFDAAAMPADGAGNSFADARDLGSLETQQQLRDWVGQQDGADYYRFDLERDGDVEIRLSGLEEDIDLFLYSADGRELSRSWRAGYLRCRRCWWSCCPADRLW